MTNKRLPVIKDCFKVRKGLCVTGDAVISGNLTVSGGLNVIGPVSGDFKDPRFDELFTLVSESSACWNLACGSSIVCDYTATAISYPVDEIDTVLIYTDTTPLSSVLYTPVGEPIVNKQQLLLFVQEVSGEVIDTSSYAREPSVGEYGLTDDVLFDSVSGFTTTGRTQYKHEDLILGTDNFTIEAWVIPGPIDPTLRIRLFEQAVKHFGSGGGGGGSNDSNLTLMHEEGTAGKLRLRASGTAEVVSSNSMIVDQWNHVVVQRTGDVLELYINGAESGSLSLPDQYEFVLDTMHVGNIGAEFVSSTVADPGSAWKWKGAISDFTITRNALYLTDFDVPTTSLTPVSSGEQPASWKFEGDVDQQVTFPAAAGTFASGEDFTIEFWTYRLSDQSPHENIMANEGDLVLEGQNGWRILYNWQEGDGYKFIHTQSAQVLNTGNVTNEEWHHVAFVRHDNNLFAYVDGNLMACEPDVDRELIPYNVSGQVVIGGPGVGYTQPNSLFSDIQITKKALYTQQEGFTPPPRFDACDEIPIVVQGTHIDTQGESILPEYGDFSAEIWVYVNELPTGSNTAMLRLFTQQNTADDRKWTYLANRMAYGSPDYSWFQFVCNDGSGGTNDHKIVQNFQSVSPMQAKTWHHVLIERRNVTEWSLYLDGVRGTTHDGTNWLGQNNYPNSPSGEIVQHTGPVQLPTWNTDPGGENATVLHRDFRVTTGGVCRAYNPPLPLEPQAPHNIRPAKLLPQCVADAEEVVLDTDDLTHDPESARIESIDGSTITFNQDVCDPECKFPVGERVLLIESQHVGELPDLQAPTVGNYEFATVKSHVASNKVELTQPLNNQYTVGNYLYMAYTPRVKRLTVTEGTSITPSAWVRDEDKLTGLLWLNADTIVVEGTASATNKGFRGGALTSTSADDEGGRGEGLTTYGYNTRSLGGYRGSGGGGRYTDSGSGDGGSPGSGGGNATSGQNGGSGSSSSSLEWANVMYKMTMGGGGGQGGCDGGAPHDSNPGRGGYGGRGGGICIIDADYAEVGETGFVGSRGGDGANPYDPGDSEPSVGGSGAGGTVLFTGDVINSDRINTDGGTAHRDGGNGRVILLRSNIEGNCPEHAVLVRAPDVDTIEKQNKTYKCDDLLLHVQPQGGDHESLNIRGRSDEMTGGKTNYIYLHDMSIDYTMSFWVYLEDTSSNNSILKTINNTSGNVGVQLQLQSHSASTASVNYWVFAGSHSNAVLELHAEGCLTARQWHHVSIAIDATSHTGEIHVDGVNIALAARADYGTTGPSNMHPTQALTLTGSNHGDILMNDLRIDKTYSPFTTVPTELLPAATADTNVLLSTIATMNAPTTYSNIPRVANGPYGRAYVIEDRSYNCIVWSDGNEVTQSSDGPYGEGSLYIPSTSQLKTDLPKSETNFIHDSSLGQEYTIEAWVKSDWGPGFRCIFGTGRVTGDSGFQLYGGNNAIHARWTWGSSGNAAFVHSADNVLSDDTWHHVAIQHDTNRVVQLFVDGVVVATEQLTFLAIPQDSVYSFYVGNIPGGHGQPYDVNIQGVRITKGLVYSGRGVTTLHVPYAQETVNNYPVNADNSYWDDWLNFTTRQRITLDQVMDVSVSPTGMDTDIHIPSVANIPTPGAAGNSICDDTVLQLQLTGGEVKDTTLYRHGITETGTVTEVDGMMQFDGSSHLVLPAGDHLDLKDNDFTIELRMNTNSQRIVVSGPTGICLLDSYSGAGGHGDQATWGYMLFMDGGAMSFMYTTATHSGWKSLPIFGVTAHHQGSEGHVGGCYGTNEIGREYHVVVTRVGDKLSSYVDGKLVTRVTETEDIQYAGGTMMIGKRNSSQGWNYIGSLNEIRIVNGQSLYTDEEDIMTPDRRLTTDDQATLHIQPHLDLECVETASGSAGGGTDDGETPAPEPPDGETGASSAGVFVTDISSGGITQKTYDDTQVAIGSYAPIVSAVVDDANIAFTVEWEGASDEWTGYPTVSGHVITKDDTSAISGDQTIRRYRATKTLNFDNYAGQTITIPVEFKGSTDSVDLQIAGGGPEILDIQPSTNYPYQQDHYMSGNDLELVITFNTSDVTSIRFIDDSNTINGNTTIQVQSVDPSTKQATVTIACDPAGSWSQATSTLQNIKAAATNSLGTEGDVYTSADIVPAKKAPAVTDITFDADPYPGSQIELKSGDSINVHLTFDTTNVNRVKFSSNQNTTPNTEKSISTGGTKSGTVSVNIQTSLKSDASLQYNRSVAAQARATGSNSFGNLTTSSDKIYVNNQHPDIVNNGVIYPAGQNGIKAGEEAQVNLQATNVGSNPTYLYAQPTGQLKVATQIGSQDDHANDVYAYPKRTEYNSGNYNVSTTNLTLTVTRSENGASSTGGAVVNIANVAPSITITSNNNNRMRSGGNDGVGAQNYTIQATSNQELESFTMSAPHGQLGAWASGDSKTWTSTMQVHDNDQKGTHTYTAMNAVGITGMVSTTISSGENYTLGGFVARTVMLPPAQHETTINVLWSTYSKLKITWSTGLALTNIMPPGTSDQKGSAANPSGDWCIADQTTSNTGTVPITIRLLDYSATGAFTSPTMLTIEEEV